MLFIININTFSQNSDFNYIEKKNNKLLVLKNNIRSLDSISIPNFVKQNQFIKQINFKIYSIELRIPPLDKFSKSYFLIKVWTVDGEKFILKNNFIITAWECNIKKITFKLNSFGLSWKYKNSNLNISKGLISFKNLEELKTNSIPCE